jgi:polysaccharide biosynthesis transport protein
MNELPDFRPMGAHGRQEDRAREEGIELLHYWNTINRKKGPIIGLAAMVSIIAWLVAYTMTPIYLATATLLIESQRANVVSIEEVYGLDTHAQQYYKTQFEILESRPLAERVINKLVLTDHAEFKPREKSKLFDFDWRSKLPFTQPIFTTTPEAPARDPAVAATGQYMENLSIAPVRSTQVVHVHYQSADPTLAANIANAHANAYIESMMDARVDMTNSASAWMIQRIEDLRLALSESETSLQIFREQEKIVDLEGLQSLPAKEINELSTRLIEARRELSQAKTAYLQVQQLSNPSIGTLSSVPAVLNDTLVQRFREAGAGAERKVAELGKRYGPKHPKMIAAQSELAAVNESLAHHIGNVTDSIKTKYEDARDQEKELNNALSRAKNQYHEFGRKESQFRALEQEVKTNRALYNMFYNRLQETTQTDGLNSANARIITPAITPTVPIKPKINVIVITVFLISLMAGIMAAFLLETLDNTIKSVQDVEEKLRQPLLGMLPLVKLEGKKAATNPLLFDSKQHGFNEAVRTVRTGISLSNLDNPYQTILVTSSVSAEGKTTTALNLASAFGQMGKVLLIEADMRRPSIAREFKIPRDHPGLSELVGGNAALSECVIHRQDEKIHVLIAGLTPPDPLRLLSSRKFNSVVKALCKDFDRIIIDCPPTLPVSDARVLSTLADSVVYVVKADATSINKVVSGLDQLRNVNAPITGIILNQLDTRKAEKYSDYGYGNYYESYESQQA